MVSPLSLWCVYQVLSGEQNSESIKQLVHPSPRLSPGKIYWLQQHPGHMGTSSFFRGWLNIKSHNGPRAWYYHRAQACQLKRCIPIIPSHVRGGWPFSFSHRLQHHHLQFKRQYCSSFLINSNLWIFTKKHCITLPWKAWKNNVSVLLETFLHNMGHVAYLQASLG